MSPSKGEQQQEAPRKLHLIPLHVDPMPTPTLSGTQLPTLISSCFRRYPSTTATATTTSTSRLSSSASRPLPLSLGRKQLASWWWNTCPCLGVVTRHPCRSSCRRLSRHVRSLSKEAMMVISQRGRLSVNGKNAMRLIKVNGRALPSPTQQPDLQLVPQDVISIGVDGPIMETDHVEEEKDDDVSKTLLDDQEDSDDECRPWMRFQVLDATTTGQPIVTPEVPPRVAKHPNSRTTTTTTATTHSLPHRAKRHSQRRLFPSILHSTKQNDSMGSLEDISSDSEGMCTNKQEPPALDRPSDSIESEEREKGRTENSDRKLRRHSRRFKKDSSQPNPIQVDACEGDESLQQTATTPYCRNASHLSPQPRTKRLRTDNTVTANRVGKQMPVVTPCALQFEPRKHRDSIVSSQSVTLLGHPSSTSDGRKRRKLLQQQVETMEDVSHHSSKSIASHDQVTNLQPFARRRLLLGDDRRERHSTCSPYGINGKDGAGQTSNSQPRLSTTTGRQETTTHTDSCNQESSQKPSSTQANAIPLCKQESLAAPSSTQQHVPSDQIVKQELSNRARNSQKVESLTTDESQCPHAGPIVDRHSLSQSTGELIPMRIMATTTQSQADATHRSARHCIDFSLNQSVDSLPTIKSENLRKRRRDLPSDETMETEWSHFSQTLSLDKSKRQVKPMLDRHSLSQSTGELIPTDMPEGGASMRKANDKAQPNCSVFRRLKLNEDGLTSNPSTSNGAPPPKIHYATTLQTNLQRIDKETASSVGDLRQTSQKTDTEVEYYTMLSLPQCPSSATEADSGYRSEQYDSASPPLTNHRNVESGHQWESLQRHDKRDDDTKATRSISTVTLPQWKLLAATPKTAQGDEIPTHVKALARLIVAKNSNVDCATNLWLPPLLDGTVVHEKSCSNPR